MKLKTLLCSASSLVLAGAIAPPAFAQAEPGSLAEDVAFTRLLAKDWGFVALASEELERLRRENQAEPDAQQRLALVEAEVLFFGARRIRDLDQRKTVLTKALGKFEDFLSQYGRTPEAAQVHSSLAEVCEYYGDFIGEKMEVTKDPDERKTLEEEALAVFQKGVRACNDAMARLEGARRSDMKAKITYYMSWLRKGTLLREWGRNVPKDREVKASEAIDELEELVLDIGEETPIGMKGLLEMAVAQDVLGKTDDAREGYVDTIAVVVQTLEDEDRPVPGNVQVLMFSFLEQAYERLTAIHLREGNAEDAIQAVGEYRTTQKEFGIPPSRYADSLILNGARALLDTGKTENVSRALSDAQDVANRHPGDFIGVRANGIIKAVREVATSELSAEALFRAALADFQRKNYAAGIRGFKLVLRSLGSDADKRAYGLKCWAQIGLSFGLQERYLEAAEAFMAGLEGYGSMTDDVELSSKVVDYLTRSIKDKKRKTKDKFFDTLEVRAKALAQMHGGGKTKDKMAWATARSHFDEKRWDAAMKAWRSISKDFKRREEALVMAGVAEYMKGDFVAARKTLGDYLDRFVADPLNDPTETVQRQSREVAKAVATFYRGMMVADEAFGRSGKKAQQGRLKDVLPALAGYRGKFKATKPELALRASFEVVRTLIALERLDEAEAENAALRKDFPKAQEGTILAVHLFNARKTVVASIETELAALVKAGGKDAQLKALDARLRAETLKTLSFARTYVGEERLPNYGLLRIAAKLARRIGEYERAESFLLKAVEVYGDDASYKDKIGKFVKPDLAQIQLDKLDFRSALANLEDAIQAQPKYYALKRLKARALGGWIDLDAKGKPRQVNGIGKFKDAYDLMWKEYKKYIKTKKKYSLAWYRFQLECLDLALKVARKDSQFRSAAGSFYRNAQSTDDFETLKKLGPEGVRLFTLFRRLNPR